MAVYFFDLSNLKNSLYSPLDETLIVVQELLPIELPTQTLLLFYLGKNTPLCMDIIIHSFGETIALSSIDIFPTGEFILCYH